ncbi:restriction endonuclease subunit S [bacterium]|nr:MAG: restriction endonuclease subunit S [bacterium]
MSVELKPGYKQTEVGVIPEDWGVVTVGEIADVKTGPFGSTLHEKDYVNVGTPIVTVEHLGERGIQHTNLPMVSDTDRVRLKAYALRKSDIVFSRVGSVDRNALVRMGEEGWLFSGRLLRVRLKCKDNDARYLSYHFHSEGFKQRVRDVAVGQTMASLNTRILMGVLTVIPPTKAEQEVIAEALSDADALIESLEQLIAKKRHIKQGTMQELLRPKVGWVEKRLGNTAVLKARIGWQGLTTAEYLDSGDCLLVTGTDFKGGYIDWSNCHYVEESRYKQDKNIQLKEHDVLVTKDGTIGKVALVNHLDRPATLNSGVFVIRSIKDAFHPDFFYYLLCSNVFTEFLGQLCAGSTINHLYQKDFVNFIYKTPATLPEQTAIAAILSDMDAEIAALEAKLAKTRQLKQGMMQELLTGKTRLA